MLCVAQAGMAALSACTPARQPEQPDGLSGVICATRTTTFGLLARSRVRIAVYASRMFCGDLLFQTSFVPMCMSTTSAGCPSNQVARSFAEASNGSVGSAPPGRPVLVALRMSVTM